MTTKVFLRAWAKVYRVHLQADHPSPEPPPAGVLARLDAWAHGLGHPPYCAGYVAHGSEYDAFPLLRALRQRGWGVTLPIVEQRGAPLTFGVYEEDMPLIPGPFSIPTLPQGTPRCRPDLVLVPLLAYDGRGGRLGYGGGFYDRTLQALRETGPLLALGVGYLGQRVPKVPMDGHDERLDGVLTPKTLEFFAKR